MNRAASTEKKSVTTLENFGERKLKKLFADDKNPLVVKVGELIEKKASIEDIVNAAKIAVEQRQLIQFDGTVSCQNCNWVKDQAGSIHHLCPCTPDFSFGWQRAIQWMEFAENCKYFLPRQPDYSSDPKNIWPSKEDMERMNKEWKDRFEKDA